MELDWLTPGRMEERAVQEVMAGNERSARFGLRLSGAQAEELAAVRTEALRACGRVELGPGILGKLAEVFCDSPYLGQDNYAETLSELVELFYHYKNETGDRVADDALIGFMKSAFDGPCRGSVELLAGRELYGLARYVKFGPEEEEDVDG